MAQPTTALVLGATGMIGALTTQVLLNDPSFEKVVVLVRRPLDFTHPKLDVRIVDFDSIQNLQNNIPKGDVVFSCIGTTQGNVKGDKALYWKIDHDIPLTVAKLAKAAGYECFELVSAVGSNAKSNNFYIRLKGSIEDDITAIGFKSTGIFRPSMLLGKRKEKRILEQILQPVSKLFSVLLFGSWSKFKAIEGLDVAKAMIAAAKQNKPGNSIYEYNEMIALTHTQ